MNLIQMNFLKLVQYFMCPKLLFFTICNKMRKINQFSVRLVYSF